MSLEADLRAALGPERVLARTIDRIAWANDASVYRLVPRVVVLPATIAHVQALFRMSQAHGVPLTFRAAGTSLSGQAVTDGILAVLARGWRRIEVLDEGRLVRVEPGALGGRVNQTLRPFGTKIGPDPASIQSCMLGGILANNSSGMCCGVAQNAYHTLRSMRVVLPDGTVVDSALADAEQRLERDAPELARGLVEIKRQVESDPALVERIRRKHRLKNTMGYSLNAFLDYERPVDILVHLMIGSEGTLGFIAEAALETVPDPPLKHTGLLFFEDVPRACAAIAPLRDSGAQALELMDRASLAAVETQPGVPAVVTRLGPNAAAVLVEYARATEDEREAAARACAVAIAALPLAAAAEFTDDPARQAALWRVRKGLIPSVGAMRPRGTSFIIEDVVFPPERLAQGVIELQALFTRFGYDDAIVFGHAKDGNLHFVLTQAFDDERDVARYDGFMRELAEVVAVRHGGALKAEHGTGRNMAPFVATEWGEDARRVMQQVKRLIDPVGLLNPGVILNDDPHAHLAHLKDLPRVEAEVDACIECGFCERVCPSRDLSMTPRQRIVVRREMARLVAAAPRDAAHAELEADYRWAALDTCATDGLCALACPVGIDTGRLVKRLRGAAHGALAEELACIAARRFGLVARAARTALRAAHAGRVVLGERGIEVASRGIRALLGRDVPRWSQDVPRAAQRVATNGAAGAEVVYFPCCMTRVLAPAADDGALPQALLEVTRRAGITAWIPEDAEDHCCGMPFGSKGYERAHALALDRTLEAFVRWSDGGRRPVVVDASPCAYTLKGGSRSGLRVLDGLELASELVPRLDLRRVAGRVALHPVCSLEKLGLSELLVRVARACAEEVEVPLAAGCCGFAGDRGFVVPELTAAATRDEARELAGRSFAGAYSTSRSCEIALARATGLPYRSVWALLERASRGVGERG